jgi:hypothetical protein
MAKRVNEKVPTELLESVRRSREMGIGIQTRSRKEYSPGGSPRLVHIADADSPSFGQDLEHIFRLNVARARRDNKRILGVADLAPRKR